MPRWTVESRAAQSERTKRQKPWTHATGPRTLEGKNRTRHNAHKHGEHSKASLQFRHILRLHARWLRACVDNTEITATISTSCKLKLNHSGPIFVRHDPRVTQISENGKKHERR